MTLEIDIEDWLMTDKDETPKSITDINYERKTVYRNAADKQGHAAKTQVRVNSGEMALIGKIVSFERAGYRSVHDFIRCAIAHRLHDVVELWPQGMWEDDERQLRLERQLESMRVEQKTRETMIKEAELTLAMWIEEEDWVQVTGLLEASRTVMGKWPARIRDRGIMVLDKAQQVMSYAIERGR